jgi:hypothetical protein
MRTISTYRASIAGIQGVNSKTGASPRSQRDFDEGRDGGNDGADGEPEPDAPLPQPPGIGRLVDKIA